MTPTEKPGPEVVCLVDDDAAVLRSIGRLLASDGLSVRAFTHPEEFLTYVRAHLVVVVVLDILMEGMSGLQVQTELRELSPHTRVIIMTGREGATTRSIAFAMGAFAFFTKPFDDTEFLRAVHSAFAAEFSK